MVAQILGHRPVTLALPTRIGITNVIDNTTN
jgi:hypothetical protein